MEVSIFFIYFILKKILVESTVSKIACDCYSSNIGKDNTCFESIVSSPIAQGRPCAGAFYTVTLPSGSITFNEDSIDGECVSVTVSEISSTRFQQPSKPVSLSANFASTQTNEEEVIVFSTCQSYHLQLLYSIQLSINTKQ